MNFSKSILTVAMLVSVSAASAFTGESLVSKEAISFRFNQAKDFAASVWAKAPTKEEMQVAAQYRINQVTSTVAPYMTKKVAAVAVAASAVTAGSVVAYKKGYFGKAANFVAKNFVAAKNAVVAKVTKK